MKRVSKHPTTYRAAALILSLTVIGSACSTDSQTNDANQRQPTPTSPANPSPNKEELPTSIFTNWDDEPISVDTQACVSEYLTRLTVDELVFVDLLARDEIELGAADPDQQPIGATTAVWFMQCKTSTSGSTNIPEAKTPEELREMRDKILTKSQEELIEELKEN